MANLTARRKDCRYPKPRAARSGANSVGRAEKGRTVAEGCSATAEAWTKAAEPPTLSPPPVKDWNAKPDQPRDPKPLPTKSKDRDRDR